MINVRVIASALRVLVGGELARYHSSDISEVERFEKEMQGFMGADHVLGVNSGTSALICALVGCGIGPGDEVLVPAYTWVATAAAPLAVGAVPVLTEINETLTIDPEDIRQKISPHTKAIIVVHMLNLVCDMDAILAIAKEHNLIVIEDACQAVGVTYRGRRCGTIGDAAAFSFNVLKNIQAGEGGAVLTNSKRAYTRALMYHDVGSYIRAGRADTSEPVFIGQNYRMTNLAAAILRAQIPQLDKKLKRRHERRGYWLDKLSGSFGNGITVSPHNDPDSAMGITVYFDDPEEARVFGSQRGIARLIDTDRHVYKNWLSIRSGVTVHPKWDPYAWAPRNDVRIREDSCPQTLQILERTCEIKLFPEIPTLVYRNVVGKTKR
jgi:dTDP-4-amino-4,6-dideoxygalactose transaminase